MNFLQTKSNMTLARINFETQSGCKWSRPRLIEIGRVKLEFGFRRIYCLDEEDRKFFPWAKFRIECTQWLTQENPHWVSLPAAVKTFANGNECKNRLIWQTDEDKPIETIEGQIVEKYSNWSLWVP